MICMRKYKDTAGFCIPSSREPGKKAAHLPGSNVHGVIQGPE